MDGNHNISTCPTNSDITLPWKKVEEHNKKAGFREGIIDGKDKIFQKFFDEGYREGFLNGFLIGKRKGIFKINDLKDIGKNEERLQDSRKGLCCLCEDAKLQEKSIMEIKMSQQQYLDTFVKTFP